MIESESVQVTCLISKIQLNSKLQTIFYNCMHNFENIQYRTFDLIQNMYYLDLDLWKELRSNLNIENKILCLTSYLMAVVMLALSVTISKMFLVKIVY